MPALEHSLGTVNQRNIQRREERARRVVQRIPVEIAGCVLGLRRQRITLERLFSKASIAGDLAAACRISDSLVKVSDAFCRLSPRVPIRGSRRIGAEPAGECFIAEVVEPSHSRPD